MGSLSYAPRLAVFYAALFAVAGTKLPYLPVWLDWRGLDAFQIALVTSAPLFIRVVAAPLMAMRADASGDRVGAIVMLAVVGLLLSGLLPFAPGFVSIFVLALGLALASTGIMPLTETIAMAGVRQLGLDYGRMRLWGSVSFIAAGFLAGYGIERVGVASVTGLIVLWSVVTLAAAFMLPRLPSETARAAVDQATPNAGFRSSGVMALLRRPEFLLFLAATGAVQSAHAIFYTFGVLHWRASGIDATWSGALWAIGVAVEIAIFTWSGAIVSRLGPERLILVGALAGVVRWGLMGVEQPLPLLLALQALHGLTFGAAHLGAVHYIGKAVQPSEAATAQAVYASVTSGIGMGLATLAAGPLYAAYGGRSYLAMALLAAFGVAAAVALLVRNRAGQPQD